MPEDFRKNVTCAIKKCDCRGKPPGWSVIDVHYNVAGRIPSREEMTIQLRAYHSWWHYALTG